MRSGSTGSWPKLRCESESLRALRQQGCARGGYLDERSAAWRTHVDAELPARAADPGARVLAVFDLLREWIATPGLPPLPVHQCQR
jgi:hypothetical protein